MTIPLSLSLRGKIRAADGAVLKPPSQTRTCVRSYDSACSDGLRVFIRSSRDCCFGGAWRPDLFFWWGPAGPGRFFSGVSEAQNLVRVRILTKTANSCLGGTTHGSRMKRLYEGEGIGAHIRPWDPRLRTTSHPWSISFPLHIVHRPFGCHLYAQLSY